MTFDELKALPTGAVVVWTFPDEEWADVKTDDSFRATSNFQAQRWIEEGHKVRVIWKPAPNFRVGDLVDYDSPEFLWTIESVHGTTADLTKAGKNPEQLKARSIPLSRIRLVERNG